MKKMQIHFIVVTSNFVTHTQILIFSYALQQCKTFKNLLRFDKVTDSLKLGSAKVIV